jgi:hypothetical protein
MSTGQKTRCGSRFRKLLFPDAKRAPAPGLDGDELKPGLGVELVGW